MRAQVVKRRSGSLRDRGRGHLQSRTHHAAKNHAQVHDDLTASFSFFIATVNSRSIKGNKTVTINAFVYDFFLEETNVK